MAIDMPVPTTGALTFEFVLSILNEEEKAPSRARIILDAFGDDEYI